MKSGTGKSSIAKYRDSAMQQVANANLEAALNQAVAQQVTAELKQTTAPARREPTREEERFKELVHIKSTKAHRLLIDFGAGGSAFVSSEGMNKLVRMLADWSGKQGGGFWSENVDILHGLPHAILGFGVYLTEMMTRKVGTPEKPTLPPSWREGVSEASKVFLTLGMSNLVRALRMRWEDKKLSEAQRQSLLAERNQLQQRLAVLEQQAGR